MNNGKLIVVRHEWEESSTRADGKINPETHIWEKTGEHTVTERNSDAWYALKEPTSYWDDGDGDLDGLGFSDGGYCLQAGNRVYVGNQHDIDGLRKLLDAIEADLKKEETK